MRTEHNRFAEIDRAFAKGMPWRPEAQPMMNGDTRDGHQAPRARRSAWPWPGMIFLLLGINVLIVATTIFLAVGDPSVAVEPDYYQKAMRWDQTAAQRDRNAALGWRAEMSPTVSGQPITLRLLDRDGAIISGANISIEAFHNAHARNRLHTTLEEIEPGMYRSSEVLTRSGTWEIRLQAQAGDDTFTAAISHVVTAAMGAVGRVGGTP